MASSVARIAATQVELAASRGLHGAAALEPLDRTPELLEYMWRRHVEAAARRLHAAEGLGQPAAVGFADLVGFTALSQQLGDRELAELVDRFAGLSHDAVVGHGGRVVKMIGDEVMFAVDELRPAADLALDLADTYGGEEQLSDVRVGLAWGNVVSREGDLFGPTVNLASRIVGIARPGSVVVGPEVHERLDGEAGLRFRSMRPRTLKGIGRVHLWVLRRP